jgi:TolA-binding protein
MQGVSESARLPTAASATSHEMLAVQEMLAALKVSQDRSTETLREALHEAQEQQRAELATLQSQMRDLRGKLLGDAPQGFRMP